MKDFPDPWWGPALTTRRRRPSVPHFFSSEANRSACDPRVKPARRGSGIDLRSVTRFPPPSGAKVCSKCLKSWSMGAWQK